VTARGFLLEVTKNVLKQCDNGCTILSILKTSELYT
jgi:hypothetical protein